MRYSLANYIVTIEPSKEDGELINAFGDSVSIGGNGDVLGNISIRRTQKQFSMKSYATGGYAVDENRSKVGSISLSLHQLSPEVQKFINLCNAYYNVDSYHGCTITVTGIGQVQNVASCKDCFLNITDQTFAESAEDQTWEFVCGVVDFNVQSSSN